MTKKKEVLEVQPLLLDINQVAKMLSQGSDTIRKLISDGALPTVKLFGEKSTVLVHSKDVYDLARRYRNYQIFRNGKESEDG